MDIMAQVLNAVVGVVLLVFIFTATTMVMTAPGWLLGTSLGKNKESLRVTPVMSTKKMRWIAWAVGGITAYVGVHFLTQMDWAAGIALFLSGAGLSQTAAYHIGMVPAAEKAAWKRQQQPDFNSDDKPELGTLPPENSPKISPESAMEQAIADGYTPARPTEDI